MSFTCHGLVLIFTFKFYLQILVDGPQSITGIHRQVITLKCVALTDIVVKKLPRNATQKNLTKAWTVRKVHKVFRFCIIFGCLVHNLCSLVIVKFSY
jgi:hypothetical protein